MQRSVNELTGYRVHATDGDFGKVDDFYFDDVAWTIRYMVVETGGWFEGRKVLISPDALGAPDWETRLFPVNLTKEQVRNSPGINTDLPVSRQRESELRKYYGWPFYWSVASYAEGGLGVPPTAPGSVVMPTDAGMDRARPIRGKADPHLRSTRAVTGYGIQATDGEIGHAHDFIVADRTWEISYLVVSTGNWLPGRKVLVSSEWIQRVSWTEMKVFVDLTRQAVRDSPRFDPAKPLSLDDEEKLHAHYGRRRRQH